MTVRVKHPYTSLPRSAFWKTAVAEPNMFEIADLWTPKFPIWPTTPVATFGSCFAQHIGRALKRRGYGWLITEPGPPGLSMEHAKKYSYDVFSARTGNIYTASMLRQWVEWASGIKVPPAEVWQREGHFFDPFRPSIEEGGFLSEQELLRSREFTLAMFKKAIVDADVFVFTLGLTESWFNSTYGYEYAVCPGTVAGEFDPQQHIFRNQDYSFILESLTSAIEIMRDMNPRLHVLLTVSPVPLTATNAGRHVVVSTMASKSILRAVADYAASQWVPSRRTGRVTSIDGSLREWHSFGLVSEDGDTISISGPSSHSFSGIKRRLGRMRRGDVVTLGFDARSDSPVNLSISISPTGATRRDGKTITEKMSGTKKVDVCLESEWDGDVFAWIGSTADVERFSISKLACNVQGGPTDAKVDYFPSYEIINSPVFSGVFFEGNKRSVSGFGVDFVMKHFFNGLPDAGQVGPYRADKSDMDIICDESLLEAFSGAKR